ncbi:MAG: hypothetical protein IPL92_05270 [Saprospiraceae bacterium]|nr:hypothetical protein [Candidatus Opimibacter iunctus]
MKRIKVRNRQLASLEDKIDLFLTASGYELRCVAVSQLLNLENIAIKISFLFNELDTADSSIQNKKYFENNKFSIYKLAKTNQDELIEILDNIDYSNIKNILIDYSSMTRIWYHTIISYFYYRKHLSNIKIYFAYSIPKYIYNNQTNVQIASSPLPIKINLSIPQNPTALIIGLGDNKFQPLGLKEYFDAEVVYLFVANSKYKEFIIESNRDLIEKVGLDKVVYYSLRNTEETFYYLNNLSMELLQNYNVVIAPCGPKPFTLISSIISLKLDKVDIWYVGKVTNIKEEKEHVDNKEVIITQVIFDEIS